MKDDLKAKLEELIENKKDYDTSLSTKKQAELIGIPYPTFMKYVNGTASCSIDNLALIADYYGVSCDWLLGRTNGKSIDEKEQAAVDVTGLSDEAVKTLVSLKQENRKTAYSDILSMLLEFGNTEYLLALIGAKISYYAAKKGLKDLEVVKNKIDRTIPIDLDGLHITAYKDNLIEAVVQSELINSINIVSNEYALKYSKTPAECMNDFKEYEKNISDKLRKGEISADKYSELIDKYYNGGADNG